MGTEPLVINPCPNCGVSELSTIRNEGYSYQKGQVRCMECHLEGPAKDTVAGAVALWNRIRVKDEK